MLKSNSFKTPDLLFSHHSFLPPQDSPIHNHVIFEMIFIKRGDLSYMIEGKLYKPAKNTLIITPPLQNHSFSFESDEAYERYNILFDEKKLFFQMAIETKTDTQSLLLILESPISGLRYKKAIFDIFLIITSKITLITITVAVQANILSVWI